MNSKLTFELPSGELTPADLVGRAFRIARLNLRLLPQIFLLPTVIWCLGFQVLFTSGYYSYLSRSSGGNLLKVLIAIAIFGGLIQLLAGWRLGIRTFAVAHMLLKDAEYCQSIKVANQNSLAILQLTGISLLLEFTCSSLIFSAQSLNNFLYNPTGPLYSPENLVIAGLHGLYSIIWLPHMGFYVFNGFTLALFVSLECNLKTTWKMILEIALQKPLYIFLYTSLMTMSCLCFYLPNLIAKVFELLPFFHLRELISMIALLFLESPLYAYFFFTAAIGGAGLCKQLAVRNQGQDLIDQLKKSS